MTQADEYRLKAAEFSDQARRAKSPRLQTEFATMAASYLRLAEQAEQNALTDMVYETPYRDAGETAT